ncbi:hypothetical protein [Chryseobacterium indoltheticum]|uniref:hypothetical protein n=1 Tax=Chryseobacterium indoltheticum TaxID=254 RepID=UPI001911FEF7|nr:hypothetical protein [Chryseobacterium indoltheticum]QQQ26645.1 hypothetical protein JJL46_10940 [Chryseobacterium indoltheticum]
MSQKPQLKEVKTSFLLQIVLPVLDNDGTLWSEQLMYFQLAFARSGQDNGVRSSGME